MRGLHRALVAGAFGGLAAATVAASGAFACSPTARVQVQPDGGDASIGGIVDAKQPVEIQVSDFWPGQDTLGNPTTNVKVVWQVAEVDANGNPTRVRSERVLGEAEAPEGEIEITIPEDAEPGVQYYVSAYQLDAVDLETIRGSSQNSHPLKVRRTSTDTGPSTTLGNEVPPTTLGNEGPPTTLGNEGPPTSTHTPVTTPADSRIRGPLNQPAGNGSGSSSGSSDVSGSRQPTGGPAGGTRSGAPGSAATAEGTPEAGVVNIPAAPGSDAALLDQLNRMSQPVAGDLWSGVDPSRAPSLMDAGVPTEDGSGLPVGGLLLASGALALAAVALVEGRRRLAYSRVTLR